MQVVVAWQMVDVEVVDSSWVVEVVVVEVVAEVA